MCQREIGLLVVWKSSIFFLFDDLAYTPSSVML